MSPHSFTPQLRVIDPRGLLAREIAWHRVNQAAEAQARVTRQVWDEAGRSVADWDPRLWEMAATANSRKTPSLSGRALLDESVDAGWRLTLSGADGQSVERWDGRGGYSRTDYDECMRPVSVTEGLIDAQPNVVERFTYGGASGLCAEHNQCGRLIRHDDPAGTLCAQEFGLAGGVLIENRRFLQTDEQPDWPLDSGQRDALLEPGTGHTTTTVFDAAASLGCQTDAVGNRTENFNTVDGLLRETRLKLANAEQVQTLISDLHYNPTGQLESERLGNGVVSEKAYEAETGRLIRIFSSRADSAILQDLNYRYDPVGNVVEIEDAAQPVRFFANQRIDPVSRYRYDTQYQLIEATGREVATGASYGPALPTLRNLPQDPNQLSNYTQRYEYDAGGNLLEMRHVGAQSFTRKMLIAPDSNRSLPEGDVDPNFDKGFDANGNLQQLIRGQDLTWDLRNQLRSVSAIERENSSTDEERYVYDSSGQRCRKIRRALAKSRTLVGEVRYLKALELRTEVTGSTLQVSTLQTGRNNVHVLHWSSGKPEGIANDQIRYTLSDHLGSSALELNDKGGLISLESYYPFGGTSCWAARSAVEAKYKTIRYSGKERDASGLYYYGFRYYAPWLQRWLNPDPLGDIDGLNIYRFVGNRPLSKIDDGGGMMQNPDDFILNFELPEDYTPPIAFTAGTAAHPSTSTAASSSASDYIVKSFDHEFPPPIDPNRSRSASPSSNSSDSEEETDDLWDDDVDTANADDEDPSNPAFRDSERAEYLEKSAGQRLAISRHRTYLKDDMAITSLTAGKLTIWDMGKASKSKDYFMSDLIAYQYEQLSTLDDLNSTPLEVIELNNVTNKDTISKIKRMSPSDALDSKFFNETELGRFIVRLVKRVDVAASPHAVTYQDGNIRINLGRRKPSSSQ